MIHAHEIENRNLHPTIQGVLLLASNLAEQIGPQPADSMAGVWITATAPKVTEAPARQTPQNYLALPGLSFDCHVGVLTVCRYVDNPENRRLDRVGEVYFKIKDFARGNGLKPYGWTNLRPSQLTSFMVTGIVTPTETEEELATRSLGEAAQAQAPDVGA